MRLGVLWQRLFDVEPRRLQQVADGVLVFEAVHASLDRTPLGGDTGDVFTEQGGGKSAEVGGLLAGSGASLLLRRHLAVGSAVVDLDPSGKGLRIPEVRLQGGHIQPTFLRFGVVALDAVLLQERRQRPRGTEGQQKETEDGGAESHAEQLFRQRNVGWVAKAILRGMGGFARL